VKLVLLALALSSTSAQTPPSYEVALIKPSDPATTLAIRRSGHHLVTTASSLQFLISWAYDIHTDLIYKRPSWLDSARFDITANAPQDRPASARRPGEPTELQKMMQSLLAERFKLVTHRETRELPLYALVVAKEGPRIRLTPAPETMGQNPFSNPAPGRLIGTQVSPEMLAKVLSGQLNRTVRDHTGLKGVFDFKLEWTPDAAALPDAPPDLRAGASLFTAIQEQLGLKLEARRGPVEVLVIDRVESTPTEN
jgi:uncharacterized protein (TIGR03435 family)